MSRKLTASTRRRQAWTAVNSDGYVAPVALAVDVVVITVHDAKLSVLVVERPEGILGLPGGFVGEAEDAGATATRKLEEKTGLREIYLEQLATFTRPNRDWRGWIPTVAHLALVPPDTPIGDPAAAWVSAFAPPNLAYDHNEILEAALDRLRGKLWWSNVAVGILASRFTLAQARQVYEAIANTTYDPSTFARDLKSTGLINATGEIEDQTGGRPAALYRFVSRLPTWGAGRRKRVET